MMKILVVIGGGRPKGNTEQLADAFIKGATEAGHEVEKVSLRKTEVKGCMGCNSCRYGKPCVQKDGFNELVPKIKSADCIVFASPLLFWTISAALKAFIERFYCIAEKDENPPYGRYEKYPIKDAALLMTSADNFFWTYEQAVSYYKFAIINYIGFNDKGMILAGGCGDTNGKPQIDKTGHLTEAYEFGKAIYKEFAKEDIMSLNIAETFELLFGKNNNVAYKALQELQKESMETDCVYPYMDRLGEMLDSDNSYIRTRGLTLIAYNAKWDKDYKIDEIIDNYLKHITDVKPITARQCIKLLPIIAKDKPELKNDILSALHKANICIYDDSMRPLVYKDIQKTLKEIEKL